MLKCRMKGSNGNTLIFLGLLPNDIIDLANSPIAVDGPSLGLPEDMMVVVIAGGSAADVIREIETNLPVKFPRDEKTGAYIEVNS